MHLEYLRKAKSILAGNLNLVLSYLIATVLGYQSCLVFYEINSSHGALNLFDFWKTSNSESNGQTASDQLVFG